MALLVESCFYFVSLFILSYLFYCFRNSKLYYTLLRNHLRRCMVQQGLFLRIYSLFNDETKLLIKLKNCQECIQLFNALLIKNFILKTLTFTSSYKL